MAKEKIWSYFIQLSDHMWLDETSKRKSWVLQPPYEMPYTEENKTDLAVWDETIAYVAKTQFNMVIVDVGDGLQYEKHPEISAPDAWSKDFLKKKLDEMRALGLEPIPKLNFSTGHDTWLKQYRRMISTPQYYQVCKDLIDEVCEVFGNPRLFHLGLDEEDTGHQALHDMTIIRSQELWWHDAYFLFDQLASHGARPWIWGDSNWYHPEAFAEKMPRDILVSNWFYYALTDYPKDSVNYTRLAGYEKLEALGFEQVPGVSTWSINSNALETMLYAEKIMKPEHIGGFLTIPWCHTTRANQYVLINDAYRFYLARQSVYPDTLKPCDIV